MCRVSDGVGPTDWRWMLEWRAESRDQKSDSVGRVDSDVPARRPVFCDKVNECDCTWLQRHFEKLLHNIQHSEQRFEARPQQQLS